MSNDAGATPAVLPTTDAPPRGWVGPVTLFLSGQTVSLFGSMLVQYAVFWYLTMEYKNGAIMMLSVLFGFLPQAVISIFGGVWADRHNRKFLIIAADGTIALTTLALAVFMMTGTDALWLIFLTLAIRSAGAGIQTPAVTAMIPQITPESQLMKVNGILQSVQSVMALVAPAAAGALFGIVAANSDNIASALIPIFFVDVITAALGIGLLAFVPVKAVERQDGERPGYFEDLVGGVRYVASHAFVRWLLILFAIVFVLTVAPFNLTGLMLVRSFPAGNEAGDVLNLTILELCFSIGMVIGGLLVAFFGAKRSRIALIVGSSFTFGGLCIAMGLSPNLWFFFATMGLIGLAVPFFATPSMTLLQETVEPDRQGRVFGFVGIVQALAMPLGMVVLGPLADVLPVQLLLVITGSLAFIVVAIALVIPSGRRAVIAARDATQKVTQTAIEAPAPE